MTLTQIIDLWASSRTTPYAVEVVSDDTVVIRYGERSVTLHCRAEFVTVEKLWPMLDAVLDNMKANR